MLDPEISALNETMENVTLETEKKGTSQILKKKEMYHYSKLKAKCLSEPR